MSLPKFNETFIPILDILSDGMPLHNRELMNKVINKYYSNLPKELLDLKTKAGTSLLLNRIGWGKSYLKQGGYVTYPGRSTVQITQNGIKAHSKGALSLKDLKSTPEFVTQNQKKDEQKNGKEIDLFNESPDDLIGSGIAAIEAQVKSELLEKLKSINPYYFEIIILKLLKRMGYGEFIETSKSHDGGIDGIIYQDHLGLDKIFIQAKRYGENKVREKDIRNFIGAMSGDTTKGVFVTTSSFDKSAVTKATSAHHVISLIDGQKLVQLMFSHNIGIQVRETYEIKELDQDFFDCF